MGIRRYERAFALPTIVITAVILMTLLVGGLSAVSSVRRGLNDQYYNKLAQAAAESGLAVAESCLVRGGQQVTWSDASPLRPNTDCTGGAACTGSDSCYVLSDTYVNTTFSVGMPTVNADGSFNIKVSGEANRMQGSVQVAWETHNYTQNAQIFPKVKVASGLVLDVDAGLAASYPGSGTTWTDMSGSGHNGTLVGSPTYNSGNGGSIVLNGSSQNIDFGSWFNYQAFTISLWVKPSATQAQYANLIDNYHTGTYSFEVEQNSLSTNTYYYGVNNSVGGYTNINFSLAADEWVNIVMIRNGSSQRLLLDNGAIFNQQVTINSAISYNGTQYLRFGRWGPGGRYWHGNVAMISVYNRVLTDQELSRNYKAYEDRFHPEANDRFFY